MRTILQTGHGVLAENGSRLVFVDTSTSNVSHYAWVLVAWMATFAFNRCVDLTSPLAKAAFLAYAVAVALLTVYVVLRNVHQERPIEECPIMAQIDLDSRELLDADGEPLAPLDEVSFEAHRPLFGTRGPQLEARFGLETLVLLRGTDANVITYAALDVLFARGVAVEGRQPPV